MSTLHSELAAGQIHVPYQWAYADQTAREAATGFAAADIGKLALQQDNNSLWILTAATPTWLAVGGGMENPMTAAEDLIKGGPSGAPTRLAKGSDGQYLGVSSGALAWGTPSGTGAPTDAKYVVTETNATLSAEIIIPSLAHSADRPPASPDAHDDEFSTTSLDAKWSESTNASSHDHGTTWPSCVFVNFTGNQYYRLTQDYAPAGAFSVTVKAHLAPSANYGALLIACLDDDESDAVQIQAAYNAATAIGHRTQLDTKDSGNYTYGRSVFDFGILSNVAYLHLQRDASNNWSGWVSNTGLSFSPVSNAYGKTLIMHHVTISLDQQGSTAPMRCGFDWVRFNWVTL